MDTYPARDVPDFCGSGRASVSVVLHLMPAMGGEFPALVSTDVSVYEFVGNIPATAFHVG